MKKLLHRGLSVALLGTIISAANAETLVQYNIGSTGGVFTDASTNANPVAIDLTSITAHNLSKFANVGNQLNVTTSATSATWDVNAALQSENYVTFTVSAKDGYNLALDSFSIRANGGVNRGFYILSSTGGWTSDKLLESAHSYSGSTTLTGSYATYSVSLTGITIQAGDSITFRIYVQAAATSSNFYFDDITLNGTIVSSPNIPEPSTVTLLAGIIGLLVFVASRRNRRGANDGQ